MAELPKSKPRTMNLLAIGESPLDPQEKPGFPPIPLQAIPSEEPVSSPEEAMERFRNLGSRAKSGRGVPLDASKVAAALQKVIPPQSPSARTSREKVARSIKFPAEIFTAIESITGTPRACPQFVRDALGAIASAKIPSKRIVDQAAEIGHARKGGAGLIPVTVTLEKGTYEFVRVLAERTKLTDKAVIEACTVLYLQAVLESIKE